MRIDIGGLVLRTRCYDGVRPAIHPPRRPLGGRPRPAGRFRAFDPSRKLELDAHDFPISGWDDLDAMLDAGQRAATEMARLPGERIAAFLEAYAAGIEARAEALIESAHRETGLPVEPRLRSAELPRTTGQLCQAARAARDGGWARPTLDTANNLRSMHGPLGGPVLVFGPNNFPFAFNGIAGGDFAAAIAAGNPVIAKAHPAHPHTSLLLAQAAAEAVQASGLPSGAVQMFFHTSDALGLRAVADPRTAAVAFTGSRPAGMAIKAAADAAGKPAYLEMSSVNPVFLLAGALAERGAAIAAELAGSCAMGAGQFCTRPGVAVLAPGAHTDAFVQEMQRLTAATAAGVLLTARAPEAVGEAVAALRAAGAELLAGGDIAADAAGYGFQPTLLAVSGSRFLRTRGSCRTRPSARSACWCWPSRRNSCRRSPGRWKATSPARSTATPPVQTTRCTTHWRRCCAPASAA